MSKIQDLEGYPHMKPLLVEVIAYAPTQFFHCQHCEFVFEAADFKGTQKFHADTVQSSMPKEMMKDYQDLSDWVLNAVENYGGRVVFKVIDATSVEGLLKSVRYGVHKYPAVVINGKEKQIGTDFKTAEDIINRQLAVRPA
jgi:hypothetical protein